MQYSIYNGTLSWLEDNGFQYIALRIHTDGKEANSIKHQFSWALAIRLLYHSVSVAIEKYQDYIISFFSANIWVSALNMLLLCVKDTKINEAYAMV